MHSSMRSLLLLGLLGSLTLMAHAQISGAETGISPAPVPAQAPSPAPKVTFSFVDPTVRLLAGSQDGTGEISVRSSQKLNTAPEITDDKLPHPPAAKVLKFESAGEVAPNIWRYRVIVSGLTPASTTQQRYAEIRSAGNEPVTIPYLLSNQTANFSWSISKPPDPWVSSTWSAGETCTSFSVTPRDSPATGVRISSGLVEQTTKEALTIDNLKVCFADSSDCKGTTPIDLPANITSQLKLCTTSGFHGDFHGPVTLASLQKPDGDVILQNANFSSFPAKLAGFLLILAGVFVAWLAKVWGRTRLERNQALIPAILMRSQLERLSITIEKFPADYRDLPRRIKNAIQKLIDELSETTLDQNQFIASKFPNPFGSAPNALSYKVYLEERNPRIRLLSALVNDGLERAVDQDNGSLTAAQKDFVKQAIDGIDQIAEVSLPLSVEEALKRVDPIIATLKTNLGGQPAPLLAPSTPAAREFDVVQLEIQSISKLTWLVYGLLTALSGLAVLILNESGFGVPLDFLFAFFWGFGLPTTIQALSPGSVASALNISVSRS